MLAAYSGTSRAARRRTIGLSCSMASIRLPLGQGKGHLPQALGVPCGVGQRPVALGGEHVGRRGVVALEPSQGA